MNFKQSLNVQPIIEQAVQAAKATWRATHTTTVRQEVDYNNKHPDGALKRFHDSLRMFGNDKFLIGRDCHDLYF